MQHGFILSEDDGFASHLVARGHHSHQVSVTGRLTIEDENDLNHYRQRKSLNRLTKQAYFLLQAQELDLPSLKVGDVLTGHIIESEVGNYQPGNQIVSKALFHINEVHINLVNPFFK